MWCVYGCWSCSFCFIWTLCLLKKCDQSKTFHIFYLGDVNLSWLNWLFQKQPPEVFLTGKYLWQSLFFNKAACLRPATLLKKRLWHRCFSVNFAKFLRTPFLQNTSGRLVLLFFFIFARSQVIILNSCTIFQPLFWDFARIFC